MRRGRPRQEIILSVSEIDELKRLVRKRTVGKSLALRSQIILLCGEGLADNEVASKLNL